MDKEMKKESSALYFLRIGGTLLLICAIVALVLSFVNTVTQEKIAQTRPSKKGLPWSSFSARTR